MMLISKGMMETKNGERVAAMHKCRAQKQHVHAQFYTQVVLWLALEATSRKNLGWGPSFLLLEPKRLAKHLPM